MIKDLIGTAWDYSNKDYWMFFDDNDAIDHEVDVFFLYPTSVSADVKEDVCDKIDDMRKNAHITYTQAADTLSSFTNMYAPYYRQVSGMCIAKNCSAQKLEDAIRNNVTRTDVYAALDYYFENCNKGKPYILAGHSQGSFNLKIVLSEYMKEHPEYMDRLIACYAIGCYFPHSWFDDNPHIKKASGETDTGVLITWNTEGPWVTKFNLPLGDNDSFCINPLNWKTDETPADVSMNKGSIFVDKSAGEDVFSFVVENNLPEVDVAQKEEATRKIRETLVNETEGVADARIDLKRGALITTTYTDYIPDNFIFGDKSCHFEDWSLFSKNIRENAKKRIESFLKDTLR